MRRMWSSFCIESGVSSADTFFITKLKHNNNVGFDVNINAIIRSLELCGLDYIDIDLYLFMGPGVDSMPFGLGSLRGSPEGWIGEKHWD